VSRSLPLLIEALQNPAAYDHPVDPVQVLETHISWVLLTGRYAYKIKKPVNFGFVDFTTLERRRRFCDEELRLNRRLAPQLYLDVAAVTGSAGAPRIGGRGETIEYAVKMVQFPQETLLSNVLERGELLPEHVDQLAETVGAFHARVAVADAAGPFGAPEHVLQPALENLDELARRTSQERQRHIERLRNWTERQFTDLRPEFQRRKEYGHIRECHGDMHLGNMILSGGDVVIFDAIEFNDDFRWIDVLNDAAFAMMDLEDRGRCDLAHRFRNAYLQFTGDYGGVAVLPFYLAYRALVRAKVACLRWEQAAEAQEQAHLRAEFQSYLDLAESYANRRRPALVITHGLSGSGKTTGTQPLVEEYGAIRLRSDVERKRLLGLASGDRSGSGIGQDAYAVAATERTYLHLVNQTAAVLRAGFLTVVDAAFLRRSQRDRFRRLAEEAHVPFRILDFHAAEPTLRQRIAARRHEGRDASEADLAVLDWQLRTREPLAADETPLAIGVETVISPPDADAGSVTRVRLESTLRDWLNAMPCDGD
jgi:aminoglycoside phosphotransferase family enzyme/predicted kinase